MRALCSHMIPAGARFKEPVARLKVLAAQRADVSHARLLEETVKGCRKRRLALLVMRGCCCAPSVKLRAGAWWRRRAWKPLGRVFSWPGGTAARLCEHLKTDGMDFAARYATPLNEVFGRKRKFALELQVEQVSLLRGRWPTCLYQRLPTLAATLRLALRCDFHLPTLVLSFLLHRRPC